MNHLLHTHELGGKRHLSSVCLQWHILPAHDPRTLAIGDDHRERSRSSRSSEAATLLAPRAAVSSAWAADSIETGVSGANTATAPLAGQLVDYVTRLGVKAITGRPYKPTTQGKNERFHQTLFRFLDKRPMATTLGELQAQVDEFDRIYNVERPHQGLPGHITPQQAWDTTPVAEPPRPLVAATPAPSPAAATGAPREHAPGHRKWRDQGQGCEVPDRQSPRRNARHHRPRRHHHRVL